VLSGAELIPLVSLGHISGITQATNAVITISDTTGVNPFSAGQQVYIAGVGGMTQINGLGAVVSAAGGSSGAWTITVPINSSAFSAYTSGGQITTTVNMPLSLIKLAAGLYNPTFQSGNIQYAGPGGLIAGDNNLIFGKVLPNPSGTPGPALLLGSGGGSGINVSAWLITDQAFDTATPGNDIGMTAGEVQPGSTQRGGNFSIYAGGADLGTGGQGLFQGGTSARGPAGLTALQGANNTNQSHPAGDVFMIAGQVGSVGASYHLIMTLTNGVAGVGRTRVNSTIIRDDYSDGRVYSYPSNGFGTPIAPWISRGPTAGQPAGWAGSGEVFTGTKTAGASTVTIVNGLITNWT
jgi:hypothetical protein